MTRTVLVTGAGGYIGSNLVGQLLAKGCRVVALDRYFFGVETLAAYHGDEKLHMVRKDVRDVSSADIEGVDAICDLASFSNDPSGDLDPGLTTAVNCEARVALATLAKKCGVRNYVLASSCSVYGHGESERLTETAPTHPLTLYASMNRQAEERILPQAGDGFAPTALRNSTVFGLSARMRFDLVVNIMTLHAVQKGRIFVMGGGQQWRPLVHVSDVSRAMVAVLDADPSAVSGEIFNVGLANFRVISLAYTVREQLPFKVDVDITPDDVDKRDYSVSFEKAKNVLGFTAKVGVAEGIEEIYQALKLGMVDIGPKTKTVGWYSAITEAKKLVDQVSLNGRLL